ncbi:MAG: G8 domain-containing protein, partial [Bacteroidota bacterium]
MKNLLLTFFLTINGMYLLYSQSPLDLLPLNQATHVVANSGSWSNSNTWQGGNLPTSLAKVFIPSGKTLTIDGEISTRIKIIRIQGKMTFSTSVNTSLKVETIVQDASGELEIGTSNNPIPSNINCKITIIDEGDIVLSNPQWEKGFMMMGKTTAYGAAKTSWTRLATNPTSGASTITLENPPSNWEVGDRIVITGTNPKDAKSDEVATIQSVSGVNITLTQPLSKDHTTPAPDLFVHAANLSRNIVIESESGNSNNGLDRGHIMFMGNQAVDINFVRVHKMGRTRKDIQVDDWFINDDDDNGDEFVDGPRTNIRGRYSIHFHRRGVNLASSPAYVRGCSVEDDPGWAYVNHSSFVHFENNVSYNVIGGGFQTESGDEIGSFANNIAIRTVNPVYPLRMFDDDLSFPDGRENSQDFAFQGDGFWIHGGGVSVIGNVASGSSGHGFIYWPEGLVEPGFPTGTFNNSYVPSNLGLSDNINPSEPGVLATGWYPIQNFQNNEAYSSTIGLATYYLHTTFFADVEDYDPNYIAGVHSTFDGFTAWNIDSLGIQLNFTERVTFKNVRLLNNDADNTSVGIWASHFRAQNKQIFENIDIKGFGTGFALPT